MRKTISKITALFLSIMMLLSAVPMYATAASTAHKDGVTLSATDTFSTELSAALQSDSNLAKGATWAGQAEFSTGKKFYARAEEGTGENKEVSIDVGLKKISAAELYDGVAATRDSGQGEIQATTNKHVIPDSLKSDSTQGQYYNWLNRILFVNPDFTVESDGITYTWASNSPYVVNETHYDIILDLNAKYNVDKLVFNFAGELNGTAKDYDIYMSESTETLFDSASLYYSVQGNENTVNEINFANENKVKYVAIRITSVNGLIGNNAPYSYLRFSEFGVFGTAANQATTDTDISDNTGLDATVNSASNIVKGFSQKQIVKAESFIVKENDTVTTKDYSSITNGDFTDAGVSATANNVKVAYSFIEEAEFNNILISFAQNPAAEYYIYASNKEDTLFSEINKIHRYNTANPTNAQYITFDNTMTAKYIGIEIVSATGTTINEIAIIGPARDISATDVYYDAEVIAKYEAKLKTVDNLMQTHFIVTDTKGLDGSMYFGGMMLGADADDKKRGTINTRSSENDIIDGDPNTHADTSIDTAKGRIMFRQSGTSGEQSVWYENTYADMTVTLKDTATVESIFLAWSEKPNERVSDYELFLLGPDGDVKNLYDAANSQFRITDNTEQKQVYVLDAPRKIKYIGVRIYRGIQPEATHNSTYARIAELGVFGVYDNIDYFDYSVTSNVGNFINESGTEIVFDPLTFTVPLFKDGYSFIKWTLNGAETDCEIDRVNNTATVSELVGTNMELVAVYEEAPTTLSGYIYDTHDELDWILVPRGTFGIDMLYGFYNYKENVAVLNGDQEVPQTERVTTGMTVGAKAADGTVTGKLEVVNIGDGNLDGKVDVIDLVNNVSIAVGNTAPHSEKEEFAIDTNRDGKITVSDIVVARNAILNDNKLESYTGTHKNISVKDLKYKYMGRKHLKNEGADNEAVYLEMTASGIVFEANFMGDLTVDIETSNNENEYITVVIDGVANNDISLRHIGYNKKATVTLARDVEPGQHKVEIYKQSETGRSLLIYGVGFSGEASKIAPKNADLLIEFVGDSITCGNGNLSEKGSNPSGRAQNGYLAYGTLTANMLGADWANISKSGSALVNKPDMANNHMPTEYERVSIQLGASHPYDFQNAERKADIVVVNLGTNDQGLLSSMFGSSNREEQAAYFAESAESFARKIIEKNGDNVNIVFAFGMMTDKVHFMNDCYTQVAQKLTDEGYNVWFCPLPKNTDGGADHPNVEGDYLAAATLIQFLTVNVLN